MMTERNPVLLEPTVQSDAALRRSRLLLHASEALAATSTTADVLATVPALLRDALSATYAAVVLAGITPSPRGGAANADSDTLKSRVRPPLDGPSPTSTTRPT